MEHVNITYSPTNYIVETEKILENGSNCNTKLIEKCTLSIFSKKPIFEAYSLYQCWYPYDEEYTCKRTVSQERKKELLGLLFLSETTAPCRKPYIVT